jgi:hypothetical protein
MECLHHRSIIITIVVVSTEVEVIFQGFSTHSLRMNELKMMYEIKNCKRKWNMDCEYLTNNIVDIHHTLNAIMQYLFLFSYKSLHLKTFQCDFLKHVIFHRSSNESKIINEKPQKSVVVVTFNSTIVIMMHVIKFHFYLKKKIKKLQNNISQLLTAFNGLEICAILPQKFTFSFVLNRQFVINPAFISHSMSLYVFK